jgi:WD40 repeat protein
MGSRPTALAVSADGRFLVAGDVAGQLTFWSIQGSQFSQVAQLDAQAGQHVKLAISANATILATASWSQNLSLWDLSKRQTLKSILPTFRFRTLAFSPAGPLLAAGPAGNQFIIWDLRNGDGRTYEIPGLGEGAEFTAIAFSPDGRYLAMGFNDSSIVIWDVPGQKQLHNYFVRDAATMAVAFHPGGQIFATGNDKDIYLWDAATAKQLAVLHGHQALVESLAFSPDGTLLASGSYDKNLMIWKQKR